ncbi:hypothetical protein Ddye_020243 [Dipteronia dyeriana]|uniref:Reverse transcriptase zinc-binding domain-containing protein n=1 Tax=Dipteronia dyeriana TaxID=168575 RepID=A0AAD9WWC9_9ROSI|nr:hypothetical protein Ddye_020243 [Dipteronia dyeriana]
MDFKQDGIPLSELFLRIYALAEVKDGSVQDFGHWQEDCWNWKVNLRMSIFNWEVVQWTRFLAFLDNPVIRRSMNDSLASVLNANDMYSVRSFCLSLEQLEVSTFDSSNLLWKSLCPPKLEIFAWQMFNRGDATSVSTPLEAFEPLPLSKGTMKALVDDDGNLCGEDDSPATASPDHSLWLTKIKNIDGVPIIGLSSPSETSSKKKKKKRMSKAAKKGMESGSQAKVKSSLSLND